MVESCSRVLDESVKRESRGETRDVVYASANCEGGMLMFDMEPFGQVFAKFQANSRSELRHCSHDSERQSLGVT